MSFGSPVVFVLAVALCALPAAAEAAPVPGHAIVARAEGNALIVWDATSEVAAIVADKTADEAANARLERDALAVLIEEEPKLPAATKFNVRVVYTKTGEVSPAYGSPTFAGIERYATLSMAAADVKNDRDRWKESAASAASLPAWISFETVGALPPR